MVPHARTIPLRPERCLARRHSSVPRLLRAVATLIAMGGVDAMGNGASEKRPGEWVTHSTIREVYSSWWMSLRLDDVERPDGSHTAHEVVRGPDAAGMVVLHPDRGVLMIWRHRFLPDTWGWEIPGGTIDEGETPEEAARRELHEETGWSATGEVRLLTRHHPSVGLVNQTFHVFATHEVEHLGDPLDPNEAVEVAWRPLEEIVSDLRGGSITDGFSQLGLLWALAETGVELFRR